MKTKILYAVVCMLCFFCEVSAQQNSNLQDNAIKEAAQLYKEGDYHKSLSQLNRIKDLKRNLIIDELYYRYTILNEYELFANGVKESFEQVLHLRRLSKYYKATYEHNPSNEVIKIYDVIHQDFPNSAPEYQIQLEKRRLIDVQRRKNEVYAELVTQYNAKDFQKVLIQVEASKLAGIHDSLSVRFYEIQAKHALLPSWEQMKYEEVQELIHLSEYFLKNSLGNQLEQNQVKTLLIDLPKNRDEFVQFIESKRFEVLQSKKTEFINLIQSEFLQGNYKSVLNTINVFEGDVQVSKLYAYYTTVSKWEIFKQKVSEISILNIQSSDVEAVREAFNDYIKLYRTPDEHRSNVQGHLKMLNEQYGNNALELGNIKNRELKAIERSNRLMARQQERLFRRSNRALFTSIGIEYGEVAPYGLRFEMGGRYIGMFVLGRSSFAKEEDIYDGYNYNNYLFNKNEVILGPNFKLVKPVFLNIGAGYGYYRIIDESFNKPMIMLNHRYYWAGYAGITLRLTNILHVVGGASFFDLEKQWLERTIRQPEYTVGFTINLR